jgi:hypothetical protein
MYIPLWFKVTGLNIVTKRKKKATKNEIFLKVPIKGLFSSNGRIRAKKMGLILE